MELKDKLSIALINYDGKQSKKRGYNCHALPIYLQRLDEVIEDIQNGASVRSAIVAGYSGRLAAALLKAAGESEYTEKDARGPMFYKPAA